MTFFGRAVTFFGERLGDPATRGSRPHGAVQQETDNSEGQ